jgi:DNA-3-methyladenine glycosylase
MACQVKLSRDFYDRPALSVARELLGELLVLEQGRRRRAGRIVECEAYVGQEDLACHASKGRTRRTEVMFGPPGYAYVYLVYGLHHCFNAVTGAEGVAAAVLVRALEPLEGFAPGERTDGPGRLCRAMGIDRTHDRVDLCGPRLFVEEAPEVGTGAVFTGPRIGVDYAGEWAQRPYRYWLAGSQQVSRPASPRSPRRRR